jgi:hypothetical protein
MGEVYEAEDLELSGHVALKTLLPEIADDAGMIARFKQEIQLSLRISHPNVCKVFDFRATLQTPPGPMSLTSSRMEFLPGETLSARIHREGPMALEQALPLVDQMAAALDAAHASTATSNRRTWCWWPVRADCGGDRFWTGAGLHAGRGNRPSHVGSDRHIRLHGAGVVRGTSRYGPVGRLRAGHGCAQNAHRLSAVNAARARYATRCAPVVQFHQFL